MPNRFHNYSLKDYAIIVGGQIVSGFDEDDAITVAFPNPMYEEHRGADGEWTRSVHPHAFEADITISLGQKSLSNKAFLAQIVLDRATNLGVVPFAVVGADGTGGAAAIAYHNQLPEAAYGRNAAARQYTIKCPEFIPATNGL